MFKILRKWRGLTEDFRCGLYSELPFCCVVYFCIAWRIVPHSMWNKLRISDLGRSGYIRCPICRLREHKVKIRKCKTEGIVCKTCYFLTLKGLI